MDTSNIILVKRSDIPVIDSIVMDGAHYNLGSHQDFRRHPQLKAVLPEQVRPSFSWVRLKAGEALSPHRHDTSSLIIVTSGKGSLQGDREDEFQEGDVIFIPPHSLHGFTGLHPVGYSALSIQFEGFGLYENTTAARVEFSAKYQSAIDILSEWNQAKMQEHLNNKLYSVIRDSRMSQPDIKERLLAAIQVWSDFFQKMVLLRSALAHEPNHAAIANQHLREEFGHNDALRDDRQSLLKLWDPALVAASAWFNWKMFTSTDQHRTALVHLVLEASSNLFHGAVKEIPVLINETSHFATHEHCDDDHHLMGLIALNNLSHHELEGIKETLSEGWAMINLICHQIAELTLP